MKKTAILGFGNPVRSDDGVGCFVIETLQKAVGEPREDLTLIDMGTNAFEALFQLKGHERIIFVDAVVNTGEPDGALYRLPASAIETAVIDDPMVFLHSLKWDQALTYAKKIFRDDFTDDILVYLISVTDTKLEIGLSEPVKDAGLRATQLILDELALEPVA